jgi:hypothetical protein
MKKFVLFIAFALLSIVSFAQVASYTFSQASNTFDTLANGRILGSATTAAGTYFTDSTVAAGSTTTTSGIGLPIGFSFKYNGTNFDVFAVNADGWISFGQSALTPSVNMVSSNVTTPISATSTASAVLQNRVSAFGRGLVAQSVSRLSYKTEGIAPNRMLTVEWRNYRRSTGTAVDTLNFQIRLHETSNVVDFIYGKMKASSSSSGQVGLRGLANTDFNNRASAANWSTTTAGTTNTAAISIGTTIFPPIGLTFSWTPPLYFQFDAGISAINAPATPVTIGNNNVTVTIKNFGTDSLKTATIEWKVNNVLQTPYSFNNAGLIQFATNGPLTLGNYNFATTGYYTIKAWTSLPNGNTDANNVNDTLTTTVYAQAYASIPFIESFDNTWINKNDTNDVPTNYWKNTPAYGNNSWRRDDDTLSGNWTEGIGGAYTPNAANATSHSARFHTWSATNNSTGILDLYVDLSPAGNKILDFWNINTSGNDSLSIYVSSNGGTNFSFVRKFIVTSVWGQNIINIGNITAPNCVIRFKAVSDYAQTDIGLDQVQVYLQPANDMAALSWVSPQSNCGLSSAEHVTVKVKNVGTAAQSNIPVTYILNGVFHGPETIPGPVNAGDTATYTFTSTANLSAPGMYQCTFFVKNPGDAIVINDTLRTNVFSTSVINTIPFVEDFNTGNSSYFMLATNADANVYYDTTGTQSTYGLHFTGKTTNLWTSGTSTPATAWTHTTHIANAATCGVNATGQTSLGMKFDLRETSSNTTNLTYTWYSVVVNGTDTLADNSGAKYFNPHSTNDAYATKYFNLNAYAGTNFTLKFVSACRRDLANATNGLGDNVYMDNLALYVPPVINDLGNDTTICQGSSVTFDAGSGTGYSYLWTIQPTGDTLGISQTYTASTSGTYQVVVTNTQGYSASDAVTLTVAPAPSANAGTDTTVNYLSSAVLHGSVGMPGNYVYGWSPADSLVDANLQNPTTVSMHTSTIYTLTVTNQTSGCSGNDQVTVFVIGGPLSVSALAMPDTICAGNSVALYALPSGGSGIYNFLWSSVPAGFSSTGLSTSDNPTVNTMYKLMMTDGPDTVYSSVTVVVEPLPIVHLGNDTTLCNNSAITLNAGTGASFMWSTGATSSSITVDSTYANAGVATISVTVTNIHGCSNTDDITINFVPCAGIEEYNATATMNMYPNPTNGNTNIIVNGIENSADIYIYSMQGQLVFTGTINNNQLTAFDLSSLTKGVYFVKAQNNQNRIIEKLILE